MRTKRRFFTHAMGVGLACVSAPALAACLQDAARTYGVHLRLLTAIAQVESRLQPDAVHRNRDGSVDIGLMQINSRWLPTLREHGIERHDLLDPCVSVHVGAWILADNIGRLGLSWAAVGAYNAASPAKRLRYANKVYQDLQRLVLRRRCWGWACCSWPWKCQIWLKTPDLYWKRILSGIVPAALYIL